MEVGICQTPVSTLIPRTYDVICVELVPLITGGAKVVVVEERFI